MDKLHHEFIPQLVQTRWTSSTKLYFINKKGTVKFKDSNLADLVLGVKGLSVRLPDIFLHP